MSIRKKLLPAMTGLALFVCMPTPALAQDGGHCKEVMTKECKEVSTKDVTIKECKEVTVKECKNG